MGNKRRRCTICGSKQWRKEPSSGLITCGEGHVLQDYRSETREINELGPHVMHKRTLKSRRDKKAAKSKADPKLYHGERARFHYYQCLQLILRLQVKTMIDVWKVPPHFENVCRDLWALHLTLLPNPPLAEPYFYHREALGTDDTATNTSTKWSSGVAKEVPKTPPETKGHDDSAISTDADSDSDNDSDSSSRALFSSSPDKASEDEEEDEDDPELERLLREASESLSSDGDEDVDADAKQSKSDVHADTGKKRKSRTYDHPINTIVVLTVACWMIRVPIMYMDLIRSIKLYEIPYLDPVRLLPLDLTRHLNKQMVQALSPHFAPTPVQIHTLAARMADRIYQRFRVFTPELNAAPLLWRATRALEGTPVLYHLAKKMGKVLAIPLSLHNSLAARPKYHGVIDSSWHQYDNVPVEVALISTVIVVLKLVYGFDGKTRYPHSPRDAVHLLPELKDYLALLTKENEKKDVKDALLTGEPDVTVLDANEETLDAYIDFCQMALLPRSDRMTGQDTINDYFPLQPQANSEKASSDPHIAMPTSDASQTPATARLPARPQAHGDLPKDALLIGQDHEILLARDITGVLPADLELVIGRAAKWSGVDGNYICGVVEKYERRLWRWWWKLKRRVKENESRKQKRTSSSTGARSESKE